MSYNILDVEKINKLKKEEPNRFNFNTKGGEYFNIKGLELDLIDGIDIEKLNEMARIMRGLIFATLEASHSGHPGGSSSKVEQFLGMLFGGNIAFDALDPKNNGRDRVVWSAGHCSPALYSGLSLIYESYKKKGEKFDKEKIRAITPYDLIDFRKPNGPQGHVENYSPLSDIATGPSGHGMSAAGGIAIAHKSSGLDTCVWVLMGDAESEEGMTYEARNLLNTVGADNMIVSLDYNHFGIDGNIDEVISTNYVNHWSSLGWNVIEIDGHNILECIYAYKLARKNIFNNGNPTVVIANTIKGKDYGAVENSNKSHGAPASHDDYVSIMKKIGFNIPGIDGDVKKDIDVILEAITPELANYIVDRLNIAKKLIKSEKEDISKMKEKLGKRPFKNPIEIKRPEKLPEELVFEQGEKLATRKASQEFFAWMMKQTAFFWAGAGDLSGSVSTAKAENIYGIINRENKYGRGIRFGIAEQNMAMMGAGMTSDRLPGNFAPISVFSTYGVFTSMMTNAIRLILIGNHLYPEKKGFFILLASHDGPETGEDGPTHQGLYWMSMYNAYPGIKVYKPFDANETIEMLFHAFEKGEPIVLSVSRPSTTIFKRGKNACNGQSVPEAKEAINGAYVFYESPEFGVKNSNKKITLVVSGPKILENTIKIIPDLENAGNDVKIIAVTSPELFEELKKTNPKKAESIFSREDIKRTITIHSGWRGFLYPFLLPNDYETRSICVDTYLKSGKGDEVYDLAKLNSQDIKKRVLNILK